MIFSHSETDTYRRCGKDFMNQTSGWFTSPNYPEDYPNQSHCTWNITVKQRRRVRLEIPTLYIEGLLSLKYHD